MMAALAEVGDVLPLEVWLPCALADLVVSVASVAGGRLTRQEVLEAWGFDTGAKRAGQAGAIATLLKYGSASQSETGTAGR